MAGFAPQPARPRLAVQLDLTLSDCDFYTDEIAACATITGGILAPDTVYAFKGSIKAINDSKEKGIDNVILVIEVEEDPTQGIARLIYAPNGPKIGADRLDASVLRIEVAVTKRIDSKEDKLNFNDPIPTLAEALR